VVVGRAWHGITILRRVGVGSGSASQQQGFALGCCAQLCAGKGAVTKACQHDSSCAPSITHPQHDDVRALPQPRRQRWVLQQLGSDGARHKQDGARKAQSLVVRGVLQSGGQAARTHTSMW
jgi:hypothetical protein